MFVYVCKYVCVCVHMFEHVCVYMCAHTFVYVWCSCTCVCIYVCVCVCTFVCVCVHVFGYVCLYICLCTCVYMCLCTSMSGITCLNGNAHVFYDAIVRYGLRAGNFGGCVIGRHRADRSGGKPRRTFPATQRGGHVHQRRCYGTLPCDRCSLYFGRVHCIESLQAPHRRYSEGARSR